MSDVEIDKEMVYSFFWECVSGVVMEIILNGMEGFYSELFCEV